MGILHKPDGRWLVGMGVESGNEYAGSMGYRDIVIQLTASGATDKSMEYLAFLQDYALSHYAVGEPIVPPNVSVYISTNGYIKAVQADDYSTDGTNFEVGGIKWNGSAWDFSNAGQSGGGGTGGGGLLVNVIHDEVTGADTCDKTAGEIMAVVEAGGSVVFKAESDGDYLYKPLGTASIMSGTYQFSAGAQYTADSADDYPATGGVS